MQHSPSVALSICKDGACPSAAKCKRFTTEPVPRDQGWLASIREPGWDRCDFYILGSERPPIAALGDLEREHVRA